MPREKPRQTSPVSLRERRVSGREAGWRALHFVTASEGFLAERVNWHCHEGVELLMFLRGAAEYEFRSGGKLALAGGQFLLVPPGLRHRAARDVRSPTVHSSITLDLSATGKAGNPFSKVEMEWLRARLGGCRPIVRAMTPALRRLALAFHPLIRQYPEVSPAPDESAELRLQLARILVEAARAGDERFPEKDAGIATAAITHLEQHYDTPIQIDAVAERIGCSRTRLYAAFKRETGLSPNDWLLRLRVTKAVQLLSSTDRTVKDIALATGFSSHAYFCQVLRKYSGRAPGEHRRE